MRNKVFVIALSLIFVLCSSFSVFANSALISFYFAEPATSDEQGYAVVRTTAGNHYVFMWSINPKTGDGSADAPCSSSMNLIISSSGVQFIPVTTGGVNASYHITQVTKGGNMYVRASGNFESTGTGYTYNNGTIEQICYYGNVGIVDNNLGSTDTWLRVTWGSSEEINKVSDTLVDVLAELEDVYSRLGTMNNTLTSMDDYLDSVNNYLSLLRSDIDNISGNSDLVVQNLQSISSEVSQVNRLLTTISNTATRIDKKLDNLLQQTGSADTDSLDDSSIGDLSSSENGVVSDDSSDFEDVQLTFGNGFDAVWDMVSQAWQSNGKVFTVVIMCLTIGLLKLILNR